VLVNAGAVALGYGRIEIASVTALEKFGMDLTPRT
jgi:hypothetical protein